MARTFSAYKNDPELRDAFIGELQWHQDQDKVAQGFYRRGDNGNFRGCAVGCAIHSLARIRKENLECGNHQLLEDLIDYPIELAYLIDGIFEGLPAETAKLFPLRVGKAVRAGANLKMVIPQFLFWILSDPKDGAILSAPVEKYPEINRVISDVADLLRREIAGEKISKAAYRAAYSAVHRAAYSAVHRAAYRSADSAADSAADGAAYSAAYRAAYSAADRSADRAADGAAYSAADGAMRIKQADKLIELLEAA